MNDQNPVTGVIKPDTFSDELPGNSQKQKKLILLFLTTLFLFSLTVFIAYLIVTLNKKTDKNQVVSTSSTTSTSTISSTSSTSTITTTTVTTIQTADPYENWQAVTIFSNSFSAKIPQNWTLTYNKVGDYGDETNATATFKNNTTGETITLGNNFQTGDPVIGGCDIGKGTISELFSTNLLDETVMVYIGECYSNGSLFARPLTASSTANVLYNKKLDFYLDSKDTFSNLDHLKVKYADVKLFLESVEKI